MAGKARVCVIGIGGVGEAPWVGVWAYVELGW